MTSHSLPFDNSSIGGVNKPLKACPPSHGSSLFPLPEISPSSWGDGGLSFSCKSFGSTFADFVLASSLWFPPEWFPPDSKVWRLGTKSSPTRRKVSPALAYHYVRDFGAKLAVEGNFCPSDEDATDNSSENRWAVRLYSPVLRL